MPFDAEFQSVYDKLIVPALEKAGYRVKRADSDLDQQNVLKDVVRGIATADLVVAELTSRNPNVLYELGLSHALRRNTILITQSMDDIPFDLRAYRVIRYSTQFDAADELSEQLEAIGNAHSEKAVDFGSPVVDFLSDQPTPSTIDRQRDNEATGRESGSAKADSSPAVSSTDEGSSSEGFLDAILSIEDANGRITERLQRIGESTQRIGESFQAKTQEVEAVQSAGGDGVISQAHRIAGEIAEALDDYAADLAAEGPLLGKDTEQLINSGLVFTSWLADQDDIDMEQAISTRSSMAELGTAVGEGLEAIRGFREMLVGLSGISRDMARGTGRSITSLDRILGALEQVESFAKKAVSLLDERIPQPADR
jgi:hypothetical protein